MTRTRSFSAISETIAAVVNGTSPCPSPSLTPPPPKRSRTSRPRATPTKNAVVIAPPPPLARLLPSISLEDDTSSMESTSTSNSVQSAMADLLDRCSSPPSLAQAFEQDVRSCLNDLCHRVVLSIEDPALSTAIVYNPIPSPVFKRKMEEQRPANKRSTKAAKNADEPTPKKKRNRSSGKKASAEAAMPVTKKEEPVEHEMPDVKPMITISTVLAANSAPDYVCEWEHCRRYALPDTHLTLLHDSLHCQILPDGACRFPSRLFRSHQVSLRVHLLVERLRSDQTTEMGADQPHSGTSLLRTCFPASEAEVGQLHSCEQRSRPPADNCHE